MNRNIFLLTTSQALMITCTSLMLTTSALVGRTLAENKAFATVPFALLFLCQMLAGILLVGLCIGMNFTGTSVYHFWSALLLLGLGWNFLFLVIVLIANVWLRR